MSHLILSVCPQGAKSKDGNYSQFSLRVDNPQIEVKLRSYSLIYLE